MSSPMYTNYDSAEPTGLAGILLRKPYLVLTLTAILGLIIGGIAGGIIGKGSTTPSPTITVPGPTVTVSGPTVTSAPPTETAQPSATPSSSEPSDRSKSSLLTDLTNIEPDDGTWAGISDGPFLFQGTTIPRGQAVGARFQTAGGSNDYTINATYVLSAQWTTLQATLCVSDDSVSGSSGQLTIVDPNDPARGNLFQSSVLLPGQSQEFTVDVTGITQMRLLFASPTGESDTDKPIYVFLTQATVRR